MPKLVNRAKVSTLTTGTGTISLGDALEGFQTFASAGVTDGDTVRYVIEDGANWEIGEGLYAEIGATLTRNVTESSNNNSAIDLSGSAVVFAGLAAQDLINQAGVNGANTLDLSSGTLFEHTSGGEAEPIAFANPPQATVFNIKLNGSGAGTSYDIANAVYQGNRVSVYGQTTSPEDVTFNNDGTALFVLASDTKSVVRYNLSTPYSIVGATSAGAVFTDSTITPYSMTFDFSGSRLFLCNAAAYTVREYTCPAPFNPAGATYAGKQFALGSAYGIPCVRFKPDGTKMYVASRSNDSFRQFSLSTPWDLTTAVYDNVAFSFASLQPTPQNFAIVNQGEFFILTGSSFFHKFRCTTPYDISTMEYTGESFNNLSTARNAGGIAFNPSGVQMVAISAFEDYLWQFTTGTLVTYSVQYPNNVIWQNEVPPDAPLIGEVDMLEFFTTDNGQTYYGRRSGDKFI